MTPLPDDPQGEDAPASAAREAAGAETAAETAATAGSAGRAPGAENPAKAAKVFDASAGAPDDDGEDDAAEGRLTALLRPPVELLPPPAGAYAHARGVGRRRRRGRAAASGVLIAAVFAGAFLVTDALRGRDTAEVDTPPVSVSRALPPPSVSPPPTAPPSASTAAPTPTAPSPSPDASRDPAPSGGAQASASGTGTASSGSPSASRTGSTAGGVASVGAPGCTAAELSAALGGGDAGAGQLYRFLVVTNTGSAPCSVGGYPGLSLLDGSGTLIGAPATRQPMSWTPVALAPGQSASDTIHTANGLGGCLAPSTSIRIYPPGQRASLVIPGQITLCDNTLTITPFLAGSTGNPAD